MKLNQQSKINSANHRKAIKSYLNRELDKLEKEKKKSRILWTCITATIGLCNISVLAVAIYTLIGLSLKTAGSEIIIPASLVCLVTISLFVMGFVLSLYQNLRLDHKYKKAMDIIQNEYMKFSKNASIYKSKNGKEKNMELLKQEIEKHLLTIFEKNKKTNVSKIIVKTLIGDKDD